MPHTHIIHREIPRDMLVSLESRWVKERNPDWPARIANGADFLGICRCGAWLLGYAHGPGQYPTYDPWLPASRTTPVTLDEMMRLDSDVEGRSP